MIDKNKSKEHLIEELAELQKSVNTLKDRAEKTESLLKHMEEQKNKNEEMFNLALAISPNAVNINRLSDGTYISINNGFTKIMGYTWEDVAGKSSIELNIWDDPETRTHFIKEITENRKVENFEAIFMQKNGNTVPGLMSASLIELDGIPCILSVTKEITQRKKIEEELKKEQFLVNALMDNLDDHIYFKDRESRFIRINKSHALSFGLNDPAEAIGKTDFDFFPEGNARQAFENEQEIIRTGKPLVKEEKLIRIDQPERRSLSTKLPLTDSDGNVIGTFGISRDITSQKMAEQQILMHANALRSIREAVSITDMDDNILYVNDAFYKTYGFSKGDLQNKSISLMRSPNNPPEVVNAILPATLKGGWSGELLNRKKDGSEFMISLSTSVVRDDKNEPICLIGVASDITARKRMLLENEVIYEITRGITLTENLTEFLKLVHQSLLKIVYAENFFVALYYKKKQHFTFPYFVDKYDSEPSPTDMKKSCSAYVFKTAKPFLLTRENFELLKQKNEVELVGSPAPSWIGIPLQTPSEVIGVFVLQHYEDENVYTEKDVRFLLSVGSQIAIAIDRRQSDEMIKLKNELLLTINAEKDKFFSIIAHDLRNPFNAIIGFSNLLTEKIKNKDYEAIEEFAGIIQNSSEHAMALLMNLLEWSRSQTGRIKFSPESHEVSSLITEVTDLLRGSAQQKSITIFTKFPENIYALVDKSMITTILRNLVSNAIKYTHPGGEILISADITQEGLTVAIRDNGIGINKDLLGKLFRIDENHSTPGTENEKGTGLGLILCKEFTEKHGGKIWVESEVGKGSTFIFTIPNLQIPE